MVTVLTITKLDRAAAGRTDGDATSKKGAGRRRTERDDDARLDDRELPIEPPAADVHFTGVGPLMDATLAARDILEVLDGVGQLFCAGGPLEAPRRANLPRPGDFPSLRNDRAEARLPACAGNASRSGRRLFPAALLPQSPTARRFQWRQVSVS